MTAGTEGGGVAGVDGMLSPEAVADAVVEGLADERFLILPHPEVAEYFRRKAADHDRWLRGHAPPAGPLRRHVLVTRGRHRARGRARPASGRPRAVPPVRGRALEGSRR